MNNNSTSINNNPQVKLLKANIVSKSNNVSTVNTPNKMKNTATTTTTTTTS